MEQTIIYKYKDTKLEGVLYISGEVINDEEVKISKVDYKKSHDYTSLFGGEKNVNTDV